MMGEGSPADVSRGEEPEPLNILQKRSSFVVRVYSSGNIPGSATHWFGTIEHVQSTEHLAFQDMQNMVKFIERHSDIMSDAFAGSKRTGRWTLSNMLDRLTRWMRTGR